MVLTDTIVVTVTTQMMMGDFFNDIINGVHRYLAAKLTCHYFTNHHEKLMMTRKCTNDGRIEDWGWKKLPPGGGP